MAKKKVDLNAAVAVFQQDRYVPIRKQYQVRVSSEALGMASGARDLEAIAYSQYGKFVFF
jgi:hypothetical protein